MPEVSDAATLLERVAQLDALRVGLADATAGAGRLMGLQRLRRRGSGGRM